MPVGTGERAVRRERDMGQGHRILDIAADDRQRARRRGDDDGAMAGEAPGRQIPETQIAGRAAPETDEIAQIWRVELRPFRR